MESAGGPWSRSRGSGVAYALEHHNHSEGFRTSGTLFGKSFDRTFERNLTHVSRARIHHSFIHV